MTRYKLVSLCIGSVVLLAACGKDRVEDTMDGSSSSSSTAGGSTTSEDIPTEPTTQPVTTEPDTSGTGTGGETEANTTENTSVTTGPPACMDAMEGQANDAECADASGCGCESGKCFLVPILGGWCGECLSDTDCAPGGCTVPNPIDGVGATCNQGEPGAGCMADEVCTDPNNLHCGTLLEVMNIIKVATCGECSTNDDCADPMAANCSPTYDVMNFSGQYKCVADGSVPNAEGCNLAKDMNDEPVGNSACMSGFCGEANVMGLLKVGVCGECNSNADCVDPKKPKCNDPQVDLNAAALVASFCGA